jgi:uncharacterized protein (TIGR00269 family)
MEHTLSNLPANAKCTRCRARATIRMPSHHANFCPECFLKFFRAAVLRAMKKFGLNPEVPLLVAVSGGKDSLALWDILSELGFATKGVHIDLGIPGFSESSVEAVGQFAESRNLTWTNHSLKRLLGYDLPEVQKRTRRKICAVCGMLKRQLLNRLAIIEGFGTLAMGHNLDDEAGRLLGNIVRHRYQYLEKQYPYLPSTHPRLPAKAKPLYRVDAREVTIYGGLRGIKPVESKCPLSRGATSHVFKDALHLLEARMPATKRDFLFTYLDRNGQPKNRTVCSTCKECGEASFSDLCAVCNLMNRLKISSAKDDDAKSASFQC